MVFLMVYGLKNSRGAVRGKRYEDNKTFQIGFLRKLKQVRMAFEGSRINHILSFGYKFNQRILLEFSNIAVCLNLWISLSSV